MKNKINYRYETLEIGDLEVHIRSLRDIREYSDNDKEALKRGITNTHWSISGVLWPASFVLATIMEKRKVENIKILEVGCGLALASIVLKIRGADITATDNNPAVKTFLDENVRINQCSKIPFKQADWEDDRIASEEKYDLIIGSDILYERQLPNELCSFINRNAKQSCEVIIIDPNRGNLNEFSKIMKKNRFIHHVDFEPHLERHFIKFKGSVNYYFRTS